MACDFDVHLEILDVDDTTPLLDFNDQAAGYSIETVQVPEESTREIRVAAPRVDGDSLLAWSYDSGVLSAFVQCEGATWGQVTTRWEAARTIYRARTRYLVRLTLDGAVFIYRAERPFQVIPTDLSNESLTRRYQTYAVRWRVQPNPTVTGA